MVNNPITSPLHRTPVSSRRSIAMNLGGNDAWKDIGGRADLILSEAFSAISFQVFQIGPA